MLLWATCSYLNQSIRFFNPHEVETHSNETGWNLKIWIFKLPHIVCSLSEQWMRSTYMGGTPDKRKTDRFWIVFFKYSYGTTAVMLQKCCDHSTKLSFISRFLCIYKLKQVTALLLLKTKALVKDCWLNFHSVRVCYMWPQFGGILVLQKQ